MAAFDGGLPGDDIRRHPVAVDAPHALVADLELTLRLDRIESRGAVPRRSEQIRMFEVNLRKFGNGSIQYNGKVEAVPATSETTGNVTINNAGQDEVPAHFETAFMISAEINDGGLIVYNTFHWNDVVQADGAEVSYREIEDKAARRLAPMLRALADKIDQEMAGFDEREAARKAKLGSSESNS